MAKRIPPTSEKPAIDAIPADKATHEALVDAGVVPGDTIEVDGATLRLCTKHERLCLAIKRIAAHYGPEFESDIDAILGD